MERKRDEEKEREKKEKKSGRGEGLGVAGNDENIYPPRILLLLLSSTVNPQEARCGNPIRGGLSTTPLEAPSPSSGPDRKPRRTKKKKELAPFDSLDELGPPLPPFLSEAKQSSERAKEPSNQVPGVSEPARNAPINGTGTHTQVSWIDSAPFWWHLPCPSPLIPLSPPLPYSSLPVRETAAV